MDEKEKFKTIQRDILSKKFGVLETWLSDRILAKRPGDIQRKISRERPITSLS